MKKNFFEHYELDDVNSSFDEKAMNVSELEKMKNVENLSDDEIIKLPSYTTAFFVNKKNSTDEVSINFYGDAGKMVENEWGSSNPIEDTESLIKNNISKWEKEKVAEFMM